MGSIPRSFKECYDSRLDENWGDISIQALSLSVIHCKPEAQLERGTNENIQETLYDAFIMAQDMEKILIEPKTHCSVFKNGMYWKLRKTLC
jgi:hypothetical protein